MTKVGSGVNPARLRVASWEKAKLLQLPYGTYRRRCSSYSCAGFAVCYLAATWCPKGYGRKTLAFCQSCADLLPEELRP